MPPTALGEEGTGGEAKAGWTESVSRSVSESLDTLGSGIKASFLLLLPLLPPRRTGMLAGPGLCRTLVGNLLPTPLLLEPTKASFASSASGASGAPEEP